jgi:glutamate-ammonia-ligase adenylyltransferase
MTRNAPTAVLDGSRFGQRIRRRYAAELALLPPGLPNRENMETALVSLRSHGADTSAGLRTVRQLVLERLLALDCTAQTSLQDITGAMTALAELALEVASTESALNLDQLHGAPQTPEGDRAQICVVGMGKLGARELNVSSDIDLIYIYDHDGETTGNAEGRARISNQEYFGKMVRAIYALVGDTTEHGFVFRVDLALRPNGNSGPPTVSLGALEEYFHVQGREWERFAWLKSRVVAPANAADTPFARSLRNVVVPFVFRRYLDYSVFDALRILHRQIREHATRRSAGKPERSHDVKLSRGGIREIEFTVQLLQVVRGGQYPDLRTRPTLSALQRLVTCALMPQATADAMAQAYTFLRQVEHRVQYLDDQQTHVLPTDDTDLLWVAHTMGFADSAALLTELDAHRETVAQEFDALLGGAQPDCKGCTGADAAVGSGDFDALLEPLSGRLRERLSAWRDTPRILTLRDSARTRLFRLILRTGQWVAEGKTTEEAAVRLVDWMEPLLRRENYLALLLERPNVHERLLRLLGLARWPARYLLTHPGVIDELAGDAIFDERFNVQNFEQDLERRREALEGGGADDEEALLNLLRRAHHAEVFGTLARDVEGRLTVEQVADDLSSLAEAVLRITLRWCWSRLKNRHREQHQLGIIAYGKLGGIELGYGSDLDLVFVYQDDDERASEVYATLVRKMISWLTVKTAEGDLYEIDTALRPNGNSGLLVTSFDAYANYQQQRGSNTAWTWEHQAMTRARFVLGDCALRARFDAVRSAVIGAMRDAVALKEEIRSMRERIRASHAVHGTQFDVKHSAGGMVDMEFAVQYLVLAHGHANPELLLANAGNIALMQRAQACGLLGDGVGENAAAAYRSLRHLQHRARLNEEPTQLDTSRVINEQAAGLALWAAVFGPTPTATLA